MRALPSGLLMMIAASAQASVLQSCPAAAAPAGAHAVVTAADGGRHHLRVDAAALPGCHALPLPVAATDVVALHPLAPALARDPGDTLLLHGQERDGAFVVGAVSGGADMRDPARDPARRPMPLQENLLPQLTARPFGVEERVRVDRDGGRLRIRCAAGSEPAGVILDGPWYMTRARAALRVATAGGGGLRWTMALADAAGAARETPLALGDLAPGSVELAVPAAGFDRAGWRHFSIACPAREATLELTDLRLAAVAAPAPGRSAWVWDARGWMTDGDAVLAHAARHGMRVLFISVPLADGAVAAPARLADFVRRARANGVEVWSVDGDPQMVLSDQQAPTVARVRAYAAYNASAPAAARLSGMQFDIEHYLLPGYEAAADALDRRYLALARALRRAAGGMPLEFVVPFWWNGKAALLKGLAQAASGLTVMDYRTDAAQIRDFAVPFLDWGAAHGKRVRIALEAGPVAPERQRRYARADEGEAWLVTLGQAPVLVLLDKARRNPHGPAFRFVSDTLLDGSATTFHADPGALLRMLPELEAVFSAWPSFGGMALHELK